MKIRHAILAAGTLLSAQAHAFDLGGMLKAGTQAVQAATLSDADVKSLTDQACKQSDSQAQIAPAKDKYAKRMDRIAKAMGSEINGQKVNYKVYLTQEVNAWAMANGCIRVHSGLMDLMNDDEVIGVIGHELGHVALGHTRKAMQTAYAVSAARSATSASNGNAAVLASSELGDFTESLINAQFSQSQEKDADNFSFDLLTEKKLKREALVTAFQKLEQLGGGEHGMLSSHPASADRARNIENRLAAEKK
ncbi:M48 family metalloprotease [Chitiniphilus purpureus]|uniref:M48 family metalloprotease n=1 Tax=Chitiniphilus purpureus TaxID=2981137 RepID=A0ABY6DPF1_9NEIS|nr:M48 family metalloprotease [Chitiniphilus sp. CD1]UXY15902.1 M48 family metalloprotease [Chitiniphilus sp. CD1]